MDIQTYLKRTLDKEIIQFSAGKNIFFLETRIWGMLNNPNRILSIVFMQMVETTKKYENIIDTDAFNKLQILNQ